MAAFNGTPTLFCSTPAFVTFTNNSVNATTYLWDFGDGGTSTSPNPTHTYNSYGVYTVKLKATGCTVDSMIAGQYINVDSTIACQVSLPTSGVGPTQTGCYGQLFDSGGPSGNYQSNTDVSITIAPIGAASIDITFSSFNTESGYDFIYVYDGPNTSSTLLGTFSGGTLPNSGFPITSTGGSVTIRQTTDALQNFFGFSLSWQCAASNVAPVANFTSDVTSTCTGTIQFTDKSTSGPTSWLWDFGDGQTSAFQSPQHTYTASGTYSVSLTATNSHGSDLDTKLNYISVNLPPAPTATNPAPVCAGSYVVLNASGNPTLTWFDSQTGGSELGTGSSIITPPLYTTTTYYVESDQDKPEKYIGPMYTIAAQDFNTPAGYYGLKFNALTPFVLKSVILYAHTSGPRKITLVQNGDTIQSITVNLIADSQGADTIVTLNFNVPAGNGLELGTRGTGMWKNSSGAGFPYTLANVCSITGNINAAQPSYYYCFYRWTIQEPSCSSARIPVVATVDQGPATSFTYNLASNNCTFNNTTTGGSTYRWDFNDPSSPNNISTLQNPTHLFTNTGTYHVCLKSTNGSGCSSTSCQNITVLTVATPEVKADENISVYPNPVTHDLNLEFSASYSGTNWTLKLTDILGNLVSEKTIFNVASPAKYEWDLSDVAKGAYLLTLQSNDKKQMRKIIRQ